MPRPCRVPARAALGTMLALVLVVASLTSVGSAGADTPTAQPVPTHHAAASATAIPGLRTDTMVLDGPQQVFVRANLDPFVAIGFSWNGPVDAAASLVLTYADGEVTAPIDLHHDDAHGEDANPLGDRRVSDPLALEKPAVAFHLTLPATLENARAHLVREDTSVSTTIVPAMAVQRATVDGIPGPEGIRTRESWGARARKPTEPCAPGAKPEGLGCVAKNGVLNAVVHHTVNANDYSAASVPALLRSIQAFHQDVQEFDDIGYNFVVDRFGTIWEARAGGADRPVVGGHTKGFNTGAVGVAVLGTFDGAAPTEAAFDSVARVIAWKFAARNVDPLGQITLISNGGDVHEIGEAVTVNTIDGHRSLGATACPGALLFARLGDLRQRVAAFLPQYVVTGEVDGLDRFAGKLALSGFALRRDTVTPVAVALSVDGVTVAQTIANVARDDVASRFGALGANHGFTFAVPVSSTAVRACVTETASGILIGCREVNPVTPAFGDFGFTTALAPPRIAMSGWAIDPDSSEPTVVHVYLDGVLTQLWADKSRPDIATLYPGYGINRGFSSDIATTQGAHQVCVFAINIPSGPHTLMGCREAIVGQVNRNAPTGSLDVASGGGASVLVAGWAIDRDITEPVNVHVYVDSSLTPIVASNPRTDVAAVFPGASIRSGFTARISATPGSHTVCVYAIDANLVGPHTLLGCRAATVLVPDATPPTGSLDFASAGAGSVSVAGWAIDPDTADPIAVHVYVDTSGTVTTASNVRPDLGVAFPAYGGAHGFALTVAATRGMHQVCAYAINNLAGAANTLLGCRQLTVA